MSSGHLISQLLYMHISFYQNTSPCRRRGIRLVQYLLLIISERGNLGPRSSFLSLLLNHSSHQHFLVMITGLSRCQQGFFSGFCSWIIPLSIVTVFHYSVCNEYLDWKQSNGALTKSDNLSEKTKTTHILKGSAYIIQT